MSCHVESRKSENNRQPLLLFLQGRKGYVLSLLLALRKFSLRKKYPDPFAKIVQFTALKLFLPSIETNLRPTKAAHSTSDTPRVVQIRRKLGKT